MTSEVESTKGYYYTPLYENEQKLERKSPMETTGSKLLISLKEFDNNFLN